MGKADGNLNGGVAHRPDAIDRSLWRPASSASALVASFGDRAVDIAGALLHRSVVRLLRNQCRRSWHFARIPSSRCGPRMT